MAIDLSLTQVQVPGVRTSRPSINVGAGLQSFGKSLSGAADVLKDISSQENEIAGLELATNYYQTLQVETEALRQSHDNPLTFPQALNKRTNEIRQQFLAQANKQKAGKSFSRKAFPLTVANTNAALQKNTGAIHKLGEQQVAAAEAFTQQNLTDPTTGRIGTFELPELKTILIDGKKTAVDDKVRVALQDPLRIAGVLNNYFESLEATKPFLPPNFDLNQTKKAFARKLLTQILDEAATYHPRTFTHPDFAGSDVEIKVPVYDPQTGKLTTETLTADSEQLKAARATAEAQIATNLSVASKLRADLKATRDKEDTNLRRSILQKMYDPPDTVALNDTEAAEQVLSDLKRGGVYNFHDPANEEATIIAAEAVRAKQRYAIEDNPRVLRELERKSFEGEIFTEDELSQLQTYAAEDTYKRLYSEQINNRNLKRLEQKEQKIAAGKHIDRILGSLPGKEFSRKVGLVSEHVQTLFRNKVRQLEEEKNLNRDTIEQAKYEALGTTILFIAEDKELDLSTLDYINAFKDDIVVDEAGNKSVGEITGDKKIIAAFNNPTDQRITTVAQMEHALWVYNLNKSLQENVPIQHLTFSQQQQIKKGNSTEETVGKRSLRWMQRDQEIENLERQVQDTLRKQKQAIEKRNAEKQKGTP